MENSKKNLSDSAKQKLQMRAESEMKPLRAMVLAAGIGSRLKPLSEVVPKPLIKIGGRPVIEHIMLLLKKHGINNVISNTHYLADKIHDYFSIEKQKELGITLEFRHEAELSGVAGGIRTCSDFLKETTACIIMGDALTDIDLSRLYEKHREAVNKHNCLITVAQMQVEDTSQFGVIVTDDNGRITSFQEKPSPEEALSNWANTGVYFFEPEVYDYIPSETEAPSYDVAKDLFPRLLKEEKYIQAIAVQENAYWADIGNPKQYFQSVKDISEAKVELDLVPSISPDASIAENVQFTGSNELGENCKLGKNVSIENCIIWDNVEIGDNAQLKNCIIGSNSKVPENSKIEDQILVEELAVNP